MKPFAYSPYDLPDMAAAPMTAPAAPAAASGIPTNDDELRQLAISSHQKLAGASPYGNPIVKGFVSAVQSYYDQSKSPLASQFLDIIRQKGHI